MTSIPPTFISHGSPMLMLEPGRTGTAWRPLDALVFAPENSG